jgi:hypothetical protein
MLDDLDKVFLGVDDTVDVLVGSGDFIDDRMVLAGLDVNCFLVWVTRLYTPPVLENRDGGAVL